MPCHQDLCDDKVVFRHLLGAWTLPTLIRNRLVPDSSFQMGLWAKKGTPHKETLVNFASTDIKAQDKKMDHRVATQFECSALHTLVGRVPAPWNRRMPYMC